MKISQILHIVSSTVGFAAVITALAGIGAGASDLVWGLTREHLLLCSGLLFLAAIWLSAGAMYHVMLEDRGRIL